MQAYRAVEAAGGRLRSHGGLFSKTFENLTKERYPVNFDVNLRCVQTRSEASFPNYA